jgi:hypothetical protein
MKGRKIAVMGMLVCLLCLTACSELSLNLSSFGSGEYIINKNMYSVPFGNMSISLFIDKLVINNDYTAELYCTWKTTYTPGTNDHINKSSDHNNTNMYLKDDLGNRYDHNGTTGAAYDGCSLYGTSSASGTFKFPTINISTKKLTFYDDDQLKTIAFKFQ